jgi:hypothetical protein
MPLDGMLIRRYDSVEEQRVGVVLAYVILWVAELELHAKLEFLVLARSFIYLSPTLAFGVFLLLSFGKVPVVYPRVLFLGFHWRIRTSLDLGAKGFLAFGIIPTLRTSIFFNDHHALDDRSDIGRGFIRQIRIRARERREWP